MSGESYTEKELHQLGEKLLVWCEKEDSWHMSGFCADLGYSRKWIVELARQNPILYDYYVRGSESIGRRLLKKSLDGGGISNWSEKVLLPMFLDDIKDHIRGEKEFDVVVAEKAKRYTEEATDRKSDKLLADIDRFIEIVSEQKKSENG